MAKIFDVACKTGSYTDKQGNEKARWQNVGAVLETKSGGQVLLLDRTFNPAGLPDDGSGRVMLSFFEPKDDNKGKPQGNTEHGKAKANGYRKDDQFDDETLPF